MEFISLTPPWASSSPPPFSAINSLLGGWSKYMYIYNVCVCVCTWLGRFPLQSHKCNHVSPPPPPPSFIQCVTPLFLSFFSVYLGSCTAPGSNWKIWIDCTPHFGYKINRSYREREREEGASERPDCSIDCWHCRPVHAVPYRNNICTAAKVSDGNGEVATVIWLTGEGRWSRMQF